MAPQDGLPELRLLSKGTFTRPVSGRHLTFNPVIDLTTTVGDNNTLYIWRRNEELVSKYTERNQTVSAIRWKEDGTLFTLLHAPSACLFFSFANQGKSSSVKSNS